jgi:CBS-domain-containing membrane protein
MSSEVKYCFEDEHIEDVARNMADQQIRRLPVLSHNKRLVGVISLADLASSDQADISGEALSGISQPGGGHCQSDQAANSSA